MTQQIDLFYQVKQYYIGTQAAIEALSGVLEGAIGYATNINKFGSYNGATWDWVTVSGGVSDGWNAVAETWTRTGSHTFTVATDKTSIYRKSTKVRYKDGASFKYGIIHSSSYSAPNTTVTLFTNADYDFALGFPITDTSLSYESAPSGWPGALNYNLTWSRSGTAFSNLPTINQAIFEVRGGIVEGFLDFTMPAAAGGTGEVWATPPCTIVTGNVALGMEIAVTAKQLTCVAYASINQLSFWNDDPAVIATTSGYQYQFNFQYRF